MDDHSTGIQMDDTQEPIESMPLNSEVGLELICSLAALFRL